MHVRDALMQVYDGRRDVYGRQKVVTSLNEATGKPERNATWAEVSEPLTTALLDLHLAGKQTLGVYLLHPDSSCGFAVWDIDTDDRSPVMLLQRVLRDADIDALIFNSGRKGRHIVVAFDSRIPGLDAHRFARAVWEQAGKPEYVECFPKQGVVTPERPYGNLIKLPLGVHRATGARCALLDSELRPVVEGTEIDELTGLRPVDRATVTRLAQLAETATTQPAGQQFAGSVTSSGFVHVPYPCFADLATARYHEGERDNLLFTLTKHLLNQGQPRAFAELVVERQAERCVSKDGRHPMPFVGWEEKVENVYAHGYSSFGCETAEMGQFCKGAVCPLYQRGHPGEDAANPDPDVPAHPEGRVVALEDLIQVGEVEPEYEVTVNGRLIKGITVDVLDSWPKFRKAVLGQLRFVPQLPKIKGEEAATIWHTLVNAALETSTLEERPADAASDSEVLQAVCEYLTRDVDRSDNRADLLEGTIWDQTDDAGIDWRYFMARYALRAARTRTTNLSQRQLYNILRRHGAMGVAVKIEGRAVWVWRAPIDMLTANA